MNQYIIAQIKGPNVKQTTTSGQTTASKPVNPNTNGGKYIKVPDGLVGGVFVLVLIVYLGVSATLWYHWKNYAMRDGFIALVQAIYFIVTLILLAVALISIT